MLVVFGEYTLDAGQVLNLNADRTYQYLNFYPAIVYNTVDQAGANFTVAGDLQVSGAVGDVAGIYVQNSVSSPAGQFRITGTGKFSVNSTSNDQDPLTFGLFAPGQNINFRNDGEFNVTAQNGSAYGVYSYELSGGDSNRFRFSNSGSFTVNSGDTAVGVYFSNDVASRNDASFRNNGTIEVFGGRSAVGVHVETNSRTEFANSGEVIATVDASSPFASVGVSVENGQFYYEATSPDAYLINSGTIAGDYAVFVHNYRPNQDTILNTGVLIGDIVLDKDNDRLFNAGSVTGITSLGVGDDLAIDLGGQYLGVVLGEGGDDRILGSTGGEALLGGLGRDRISGGDGDDFIDGGRDSDALDGGRGYDILDFSQSGVAIVADLVKGKVTSVGIDRVRNFEHLVATSFDDRVSGRSGDERFDGLTGDDQLSGAAGDDTLSGGLGADLLTGGKGRDIFLFSTGGGHDVINDFLTGTAGDRIKIHGYSAFQEIVQDGADVRLVLSDTDELRLLGVESSALIEANYSFDASALAPDPVRGLDARMNIDSDLRVLPGEQIHMFNPGLSFVGIGRDYLDIGITLYQAASGPPTIHNAGWILIEADTPADTTISLAGIAASFNPTNESSLIGYGRFKRGELLVNEASGLIEVVNHGGSGEKAGLDTQGIVSNYLARFWNAGEFSVSAARGDATAYYGAGLVNSGLIEVASDGKSMGAAIDVLVFLSAQDYGGDSWNSGQILVSGVKASVGVHFGVGKQFGGFVNSGAITVTDQTAAKDSIGIRLEGNDQIIWNSGVITAEFAISYDKHSTNNSSFTIYNTGTLNGDVLYKSGSGYIRNTGVINGDVAMNLFADVFDSRGGTISGFVLGREGNDKLYSGAGVDHLDGGRDFDTISGGGGDDLLTGGAGHDVFHFAVGDGVDTVTDFETGELGDVLRFSGYAGYLSLEQQGADVLIRLSATDSVLLLNCSASEIAGDRMEFNASALPDPRGIPRTPVAPDAPEPRTDSAPDFLIPHLGTDGDDTLTDSGAADVLIGYGGNDTYFVGSVADEVVELAEGGDDLVRSRAAAFVLEENIERLTLEGRAVRGIGNDLDNIILGGDRGNTLDGAGGHDLIAGGAGSDKLDGGYGDDTLIGGAGRDVMSGGMGADIYRFFDGDTGRGARTADRLSYFSKNEADVIDVSAMLPDGEFSFIGTASFSHAAGELRTYQTAGLTFVEADTDGDGQADLVIRLENSVNLTAVDFVL